MTFLHRVAEPGIGATPQILQSSCKLTREALVPKWAVNANAAAVGFSGTPPCCWESACGGLDMANVVVGGGDARLRMWLSRGGTGE